MTSIEKYSKHLKDFSNLLFNIYEKYVALKASNLLCFKLKKKFIFF